jgi:hypothetical protein
VLRWRDCLPGLIFEGGPECFRGSPFNAAKLRWNLLLPGQRVLADFGDDAATEMLKCLDATPSKRADPKQAR